MARWRDGLVRGLHGSCQGCRTSWGESHKGLGRDLGKISDVVRLSFGVLCFVAEKA